MTLILAVDDDANIRVVLRQFLEDAGYSVITASSGQEGFELARKHRPALVLMDFSMPGELNGVQTLAMIKNDQKTCHIPVVMLTGTEDLQVMEDAMYEYAEVYLQKPCAKAKLLETVATVLSAKRAI